LVEVWQDVLNIQKIGIKDDFFELGGQSIIAMRTISAIRKQLNFELGVRELFTHRNILDLSNYFEQQSSASAVKSISKIKSRPALIPLSFSQERLWFIDKFEGSIQYHIPQVLQLNGNLDADALEQSIATIISRHESLRTVFKEIDGTVYQFIQSPDYWKMKQTNVSDYSEQKLSKYIQSRNFNCI
jgi:acyl carrier protein